jgi:hypothetical protein
MTIKTEVETPEELDGRLENFFKTECIDREQWFKKALLNGIETLIRRWEAQEKRRLDDLNRRKDSRL